MTEFLGGINAPQPHSGRRAGIPQAGAAQGYPGGMPPAAHGLHSKQPATGSLPSGPVDAPRYGRRAGSGPEDMLVPVQAGHPARPPPAVGQATQPPAQLRPVGQQQPTQVLAPGPRPAPIPTAQQQLQRPPALLPGGAAPPQARPPGLQMGAGMAAAPGGAPRPPVLPGAGQAPLPAGRPPGAGVLPPQQQQQVPGQVQPRPVMQAPQMRPAMPLAPQGGQQQVQQVRPAQPPGMMPQPQQQLQQHQPVRAPPMPGAAMAPQQLRPQGVAPVQPPGAQPVNRPPQQQPGQAPQPMMPNRPLPLAAPVPVNLASQQQQQQQPAAPVANRSAALAALAQRKAAAQQQQLAAATQQLQQPVQQQAAPVRQLPPQRLGSQPQLTSQAQPPAARPAPRSSSQPGLTPSRPPWQGVMDDQGPGAAAPPPPRPAPVPAGRPAQAPAPVRPPWQSTLDESPQAGPAMPPARAAPIQRPAPQQRPVPQRQAPAAAPPQQRAPQPASRPPPVMQPRSQVSSSWEDQPVSPSRGYPVIPEGVMEAAAVGPLMECPTCGRSFNENAFAKHAKVCEKVFVKKRKVFNITEARVAGTEAAKFFDLRKGVPKSELQQQARGGPASSSRPAGGRGGGRPGSGIAQAAGQKMSKWKMESEQLRAAMRANRMMAAAKARGEDIRNMTFDTGPEVPDDRVPCPHCGRRFAPLTADRHIPHCKNTVAKPNFLKAGGGGPSYTRRK